ncbi:hypothetical protein [Geodermatophilus sp. CPCC 205761]|uniref:hypothetical protein n=1 Tax=Geodermatophilus sp. CPCC 205761 TaxID=2936597 RepID=UPI003EF000AB
MAIDKFTESVGSKLGERAAGLLTSAPIVYAGAGLLVWLVSVGPGDGWSRLKAWSTGQDSGRLLVWAAAALVAAGAAAAVVQRFVPSTIRLLEGYWPAPFRRLATRLARRAWSEREKAATTLRGLSPAIQSGAASITDERRYVEADALRARIPSQPAWTMPTRLGNILRAAETRPMDKYSLEPIKLWPAMWLVLPNDVRQELIAARARLDKATAGVLWCLLGGAFGALAWWAAPAALVAAIAAYRFWVLPAGTDYADLFEAAYDVHRFDLYKALHIPLPADAAVEQLSGSSLTELVWRGRDDAGLVFAHGGEDARADDHPEPRGLGALDGGWLLLLRPGRRRRRGQTPR